MSNWQVFIDESGDVGGEIFSLSMYVSIKAEAAKAERQWRDKLEGAGLKFFHMVDCAHHKGEFEKISRPEAAELEIDLISIINRFFYFGVSLLFKPKGWADDNIIFLKIYPLAVLQMIEQACGIIRSRDPEAKIEFFIECGHAHEKIAKNAVPRAFYLDQLVPCGNVNIQFVDKSRQTLLQAADLLAWQSTKYIKTMRQEEFSIRKDLSALLQLPHYFQAIYSLGEYDINVFNISNPSKDLGGIAPYIRAIFGDGDIELLRRLHFEHDKNGAHKIPGWNGLALAVGNQRRGRED